MTIIDVVCVICFSFRLTIATDVHASECEVLQVTGADYASGSGLYFLQRDLQCNDPSDLVYMKEGGQRYIFPFYSGWTLSSWYCIAGGYYRAEWMLFPWSAPWSVGGVYARCLNHSVYLYREEPMEGVFEISNLVDLNPSTAARFVSPLLADVPLMLAVRAFHPFWRSSIGVYVTDMNTTCYDTSGYLPMPNKEVIQVAVLQSSGYDFCPTSGKSSFFCGRFTMCTMDARINTDDLMFECPCDGSCDVVNIRLNPNSPTRAICSYTIHEIDIYQ